MSRFLAIVFIALNVPLNNALAAADPVTTAAHAVWSNYLTTGRFGIMFEGSLRLPRSRC